MGHERAMGPAYAVGFEPGCVNILRAQTWCRLHAESEDPRTEQMLSQSVRTIPSKGVLMNAVFDQAHHLSPTGVDYPAAATALEAAAASATARRRKTAEHATAIAEIEAGHRYRLRGLLGDRGYEEFRALRARRYERSRLPGSEPGSHLDEVTERADRRMRMEKLLAELEVSPERVRAVNRETIDSLAAKPWLPSLDEKHAELLRPLDIPMEIREGHSPGWTIARPPYPEWSWWYDGWTSGFHFSPTLFLDTATGEVGQHNYLWDNDASDFDHAQIEYNASVAFWYQMPRNGRLSIWIEGVAIETNHQLTTIDEWGVSDAFSWQENYLVAKADGLATDPYQKALTSWMKFDGDSEGAWNISYLQPSQTFWANLNTQNWFPAGSWVRVAAGTTTWHRATANDMEVYSNARFRWSLRSVWVDAIG
jgi:hypothetical protein